MLKTPIKRALVSVSNKEGIVEFAKGLAKLNIEIISTGGTSQLLRSANVPVKDVSEITQFPEMMDGRVKTLHPKVHGGILGRRDVHAKAAEEHNINWIDLVVVNLYPFAATIKKPNVTFNEAVENIDIGGPTMIRSAAKNMEWVGVVVDPMDYQSILNELSKETGLSLETRKKLAKKAFGHTALYDSLIHYYLDGNSLPEEINLHLEKKMDLRYGENPHQTAAAYQLNENQGILAAKQWQGKQLSYNNIMDADAALACVREFSEPACVIVKHANPCGVAIADSIEKAFYNAYHADAQSAFGGIIALNRPCTKELADQLSQIFFEVLVAPQFEEEALNVLSRKPNLRLLELPISTSNVSKQEMRFIEGGVLIQEKDHGVVTLDSLKCMTKRRPSEQELQTMLFAWGVIKFVKSNAILIARNNVTVGIGAGQVSRIDSVKIAVEKAGNDLDKSVLASDAFFPFRDSIDQIAKTGIKAIIQPGGSMRDDEVIAACDEHNIAMVFTGQRCFKH